MSKYPVTTFAAWLSLPIAGGVYYYMLSKEKERREACEHQMGRMLAYAIRTSDDPKAILTPPSLDICTKNELITSVTDFARMCGLE